MVIYIFLGNIMNIIILKSCFNIFDNLVKGFLEGIVFIFDYFLKDRVFFMVKNVVGVFIKVKFNCNFRVMGFLEKSDIFDVDVG